MSITIEEMKQRLINYINNIERSEIIRLYQKIYNVTIENVGDNWYPCYIEQTNTQGSLGKYYDSL